MSNNSTFQLKTYSATQNDQNDAFSKPVVRRRFQATQAQQSTVAVADDAVCPSVSDFTNSPVGSTQVFSPPVSIPETSSDGNGDTHLSSSDSEPDLGQLSQSSTCSLNRKFESSNISTEEVPKPVEKKSRTYEFDDEDEISQPPPKMIKESGSDLGNAKFIPKKDRKLVYNHKWTTGEDEDEVEKEQSSTSVKQPDIEQKVRQPILSAHHRKPIYSRQSSSSNVPSYRGRVRNVKDANEILESGEHDDFKHDIVYILSSLKQKNSSIKVKCLSTLSLAKKCVYTDFRQFIKAEGMCGSVMKALSESSESELFALCASTVIYLLSRDFNSIKIDPPSLRLISQLLRVESLGNENEDEKEKILNMVWDVFCCYLEKQESCGKKVAFDMKKEHISPSNLILEALVFISTRCSDDEAYKTELVNLGILQFIVMKIESLVNRIEKEDDAFSILLLDRCFRILEMCSMLHKKNQAFLISHRGSTLINCLAKFLPIIHEKVPNQSEEMARTYMSCLALMARVLINLSHENELCCSKLGQIPGFLPSCLTAFTYLAPKYAEEEKKFDIYVMMSSLLTNLVERCNLNRKNLIGINIKVTQPDGSVVEEGSLEALAKLFVNHEAKAKTIDEDLDKELAFEEGGDDKEDGSESEDEEGARKDGRLDRNKLENMDEVDMVNAVQEVMSKASAHMEDSLVASYLALLIGCLLQQNEEHSTIVRELLPNRRFDSMIAQLSRFLEFMKFAMSKKGENSSACRSIEKIIDVLENLD